MERIDLNMRLREACINNNQAEVSRLLALGVSNKSEMLLLVAIRGDLEIALILLTAGADVHYVDEEGHGFLEMAAYSDSLEMVELALSIFTADDARDQALCWASCSSLNFRKRESIVQYLLELGANPNYIDSTGGYPVAMCIGSHDEDDLATARHLLEAGANPNLIAGLGWYSSPLGQAILYGNEEMVKLLLAYGADPNQVLEKGDRPLNLALYARKPGIVEALIAAGAHVPPTVETDLETAVVWGDSVAVERLLSTAGPHDLDGLLVTSLLHSRSVDTVRKLLEHGSNANVVAAYNSEQRSLLGMAASANMPETLQVLLEFGADPYLAGEASKMVKEAASWGQADVLQTLINWGLPYDEVGSDRRTPLENAAESGHIECVRVLLDAGAVVNRESLRDSSGTYRGNTALMRALLSKNVSLEMTILLLGAGAELNAVTAIGLSPFLCAVENAPLEVVQHLVDRGANINARTSEHRNRYRKGGGSMLYSVLNFDRRLVPYVCGLGFDINEQTLDGTTALMHAATYCAADVIQILLDLGADVSLRDSAGRTALDHALLAEEPDVVGLLVAAGAQRGIQ